jgi:hypothetical protein
MLQALLILGGAMNALSPFHNSSEEKGKMGTTGVRNLKAKAVLLVVGLAAEAALGLAASAVSAATTFSNNNGITINDIGGGAKMVGR